MSHAVADKVANITNSTFKWTLCTVVATLSSWCC